MVNHPVNAIAGEYKVFWKPVAIKNPLIKNTTNNHPRATFSIAVNRYYAEGQKDTDFIPVCMWGRLAELSQQLLRKGAPILICGRISVRRYEKDGENKQIVEIVGENFQLLERNSSLLKDLPHEEVQDQTDVVKAA